MAESKKEVAKETAFMKKKGAPASMIKNEAKEARFAKGGSVDGVASRGKTKGTMIKMKHGGKC